MEIYKECNVPTQVLPSGASCSPGVGHWHRTSPFNTSQPYWQLAMPQVRASNGNRGNTTQHILTHAGATRKYKEGTVYNASQPTTSHPFSFHVTHTHSDLIFCLQPMYKSQVTQLPFVILARLTLGCRRHNRTHSAIIRFLCCAVQLLCAHTLAHSIPILSLLFYPTPKDS